MNTKLILLHLSNAVLIFREFVGNQTKHIRVNTRLVVQDDWECQQFQELPKNCDQWWYCVNMGQ